MIVISLQNSTACRMMTDLSTYITKSVVKDCSYKIILSAILSELYIQKYESINMLNKIKCL